MWRLYGFSSIKCTRDLSQLKSRSLDFTSQPPSEACLRKNNWTDTQEEFYLNVLKYMLEIEDAAQDLNPTKMMHELKKPSLRR